MRWKELILNNIWWKIMALILATSLWLILQPDGAGDQLEFRTAADLVHQVSDTGVFTNLPVRILKAPGDLREFRVTPPQVDVMVSGEFAMLRRIRASDLQAFVDVTTMGEDVTTNSVQLSGPEGITLDRASPEIVTLEEIDRNQAPPQGSSGGLVHVRSTIEFPDIELGILKAPGDARAYRLDPSRVDIRVSGDVARLEQLSARDIRAFVDLTGLERATGTNPVRMVAPQGLKLEQATPPHARVQRIESP